MLSAAKIRPLEEFFELPSLPSSVRLTPSKEVAVALNEGSIICLCRAPRKQAPEILRTFRVEKLAMVEGKAGKPQVRWTLMDNSGCWFDGLTQQVDIYKGVLLIQASDPLVIHPSPYGQRVVFKLKLPSQYRVHHLAYMRKYFPKQVAKLHSVT